MNKFHEIRIKRANLLIIGHLNINSLQNKFEMLKELIKDKIGIFLIFEIKLDTSFSSGQFIIQHYSTAFILDNTQNGGSLLLCVLEDIPCKIYSPEKATESFLVEIKLKVEEMAPIILIYSKYKFNS